MDTNLIKTALINEAREKHGEIFPCGTHKDIMECFTVYKGRILLWYNDKMDNTHIVKSKEN